MPADLTIFTAKYLILIDVALAVVVLGMTLYGRPRIEILRWVVAATLILALSLLFSRIGSVVYDDPRPFISDHVRPLIPHAADNGFPSDHALLAAAVVALVAIANLRLVLPFAFVGVLIDWARIGAGIHHVADVVGSSVIVALATLIALLLVSPIVRRLVPYVPAARPVSRHSALE